GTLPHPVWRSVTGPGREPGSPWGTGCTARRVRPVNASAGILHPSSDAGPRHRAEQGSDLAGTVHLIRLFLRLDRFLLPLWVVAIVGMALASASAVQGLYSTPAQWAGYAATV